MWSFNDQLSRAAYGKHIVAKIAASAVSHAYGSADEWCNGEASHALEKLAKVAVVFYSNDQSLKRE